MFSWKKFEIRGQLSHMLHIDDKVTNGGRPTRTRLQYGVRSRNAWQARLGLRDFTCLSFDAFVCIAATNQGVPSSLQPLRRLLELNVFGQQLGRALAVVPHRRSAKVGRPSRRSLLERR